MNRRQQSYFGNSISLKKSDMQSENKLYEDQVTVVYHNGCGEIFVGNKNSGKTIRITPVREDISVSCYDCYLIAFTYNSFKTGPFRFQKE